MLTSHDPPLVRLSLATFPTVTLESWVGDFDGCLLSLYSVRRGAWILVSEWINEDRANEGSTASIVITGNDSNAVSSVVAMIECRGKSADELMARMMDHPSLSEEP
jgi:hypothetical protein